MLNIYHSLRLVCRAAGMAAVVILSEAVPWLYKHNAKNYIILSCGR